MLFSNLPPVLATQEFARERSDILAAARTGVTVEPAAAERFGKQLRIDLSKEVGAFRKFVEVTGFCESAPIVDVSNQTGSILTVEPLREPFKLGTVFNIENVTTYMASEDRPVRRDFIVAMRAEAGERCIRIYPPIEMPRTVVALPQKGARLIVWPECVGVPMPRS